MVSESIMGSEHNTTTIFDVNRLHGLCFPNEKSPNGGMGKVLNYDPDVSHSITFIFGLIPFKKIWTPLFLQLRAK